MADYREQHAQMITEIEDEARYSRAETGREHFSPKVIEAIHRVPRHIFVPAGSIASAYANRPLPIGHGQTISQPFIVALMTELLDLDADDMVLEIGTGCGYQTAVLCELARQVYTVELVPELAEETARRLQQLGYHNVETRIGDGSLGWPERAPFDAIIVTAAPQEIPHALIEQLKPGGILVIPVGRPFADQQLLRVVKDEAGSTHSRALLGVAFVPLVSRPSR